MNKELLIQCMESLKRNNIAVIEAKDKKEALSLVKQLIKPKDKTAHGGSKTLDECKITEFLEKETKYIEDRKKHFGAKFFLSSANGIAADTGYIYNTDGMSNRIACLAFGPEKVIFVVGLNKIVANDKEADERIKKIAAPMNARRFNIDAPCVDTGECIGLENNKCCDSEKCICSNMLVMKKQMNPERVGVIIVHQSLGF